ncbi:hypothetical protein [Neptunicoccus sediminis]|uniref:hypothetical protein n=1 Tax=Neptunicoccus sediminis TaxID=1892596 RepID=UPI001FE1C2CC|nr:hypothetical protein [Neptunicoccus sediminis]
MRRPCKKTVISELRALAIWFVVVTVLIYLYADATDPMPVSITSRLLISTGIVAFLNLPFVKAIGRIYLNTTPDDADLED